MIRDPGGGWATEQLSEFLSAVSSCPDRDAAFATAVERAAEAVDAEVAAVVAQGHVLALVGFGQNAAPHEQIVEAADGLRSHLDVPGAGSCRVALAAVDDRPTSSVLLLARSGEEFRPEELNLLRAMAKTLGLTLRTLERTLEDLRVAMHDGLTGLPSRALFLDRLAHAILATKRRGTGVAVLFIDLDQFKVVNDSMSHAAGDELLVLVAERLRDAVRTVDTTARLGGDEFAVLIEEVNALPAAIVVAGRIVETLIAPFTIWGREFFVSASIGVALSSSDSQSPSDLLRNADLAMYRAKARQLGSYAIYEPSMHTALMARLDLEAQLRQAIAASEFRVYYQPIFKCTGPLQGFEALVRWQHPTRGLLSPADFLPLAEETGLIAEIGWTVLREACRQASTWRPSTIEIAVNLAAAQLAQPDFSEKCLAALDASGLSPERLVLELTETMLMNDSALSVAQLWALHAKGVRFAIDDFGMGHSSLRYLLRFPIDIIKIPKPFIDGLEGGGRDSLLARAIVGLGQGLGMVTVAEGVEHEPQLELLRLLGCSSFQGFLGARPMRADAVATLLRGVLGRRDPVQPLGPASVRSADRSWSLPEHLGHEAAQRRTLAQRSDPKDEQRSEAGEERDEEARRRDPEALGLA